MESDHYWETMIAGSTMLKMTLVVKSAEIAKLSLSIKNTRASDMSCEICGGSEYYKTRLCQKHYTRKWRYGSPHILKQSKANSLSKELIYKNITVTPTWCWLWNMSINNKGYGTIRFNNKTQYAHRISYQIFYGDFDPKMNVCHTCDRPRCVNPDHLFLGTQKENIQDMLAKGRGRYQ